MKKLLPILFLFIAVFSSAQNEKCTKVFLVRHAETVNDGSKDPMLSETGLERAKQWGKVLQSEKIDEIYSTDYKRTQATAMAIANANNVNQIKLYEPGKLYSSEFLNQIEGKTIVVVGHSNTIPFLANKLIGEDKYRQIEHTNHSNLYIVTLQVGCTTNSSLLCIE